jgi:hypothetical protein
VTLEPAGRTELPKLPFRLAGKCVCVAGHKGMVVKQPRPRPVSTYNQGA